MVLFNSAAIDFYMYAKLVKKCEMGKINGRF